MGQDDRPQGKSGMSRAARTALLAGGVTTMLAAPGMALAQIQDAGLADDFYREMAPQIRFVPGPNSVAVVSNRAAVGYYRVVIKRNADNPPAIETEGCKAALARAGSNSKFLNILFNRKFDVGMAVSVPLALELGSADTGASEKSRAEVNLFRIRREGDRKCRFDLSTFDQEGTAKYAAPWIPIEHALVASDQQAVVRFRPWVISENNRARVDAFLGGIGKLVNLLGPIGTIFAGPDDKYALKGQGQASLFSPIANTGVVEGPQKTMRIVVNPATGTSHTPQAAKFEWVLDSADPQKPFKYTLSFTVQIEYRASQLMPEAETSFRNLAEENQDYFRGLIQEISPLAGPWWKLSPTVSNLYDQPSVDKFDAACLPAFTDLKTLGFSREDRALLVYALARDKFSEGEVSKIGCLTGQEGAPWLAKFKIAIPPFIPPTDRLDWEQVLKASERAFRQPSQVTAETESLARLLDDRVMVSGNAALLPGADGQPLYPIRPSKPVYFDRAAFLATFTKLQPASNAKCFSPFATAQNANASRPEFGFPGSSGMLADDAAVAHLFRTQDGNVRLVVLGLRGKKAGIPVINKLWIGDAIDMDDPDLKAIQADMLKNPNCAAASFKGFLTPAAPGPDAAANSGGASAGSAPTPQNNAVPASNGPGAPRPD